jgi:hypothetical protein
MVAQMFILEGIITLITDYFLLITLITIDYCYDIFDFFSCLDLPMYDNEF